MSKIATYVRIDKWDPIFPLIWPLHKDLYFQ